MSRDTPINSWNDKNSMTPSLYKLRGKYTRTKDSLPVLNYKQLEKSLPQNYGLQGDNLSLLEQPLILEGIDGQQEKLTELKDEPEYYLHFSSSKGSVGDKISVEADWDLSGITEVYVNGIPADFSILSAVNLVFTIPYGATSGTVEFVSPDSSVESLEVLEVV